jgi:hypothetical protein
MPRVSAAFFAVGVLYVLIGMFRSMHMREANDFVMAPAHAHLNLLGWVTMGLYGTFYALSKRTMSLKLAWTNFVISALGVFVMIPSLAFYLGGGSDPKYIPGIVAGEVLTVLGTLIFGASVVRELLRKPA